MTSSPANALSPAVRPSLQRKAEASAVLRRRAGRLARWIFLLVAWCGPWFSGILTASEVSRESEVKAVCLWRLAQFVTWPTNAFENASSPIVIGILGDNSFANLLQTVVDGETAHGRSLLVRHFRTVEEIKPCHILYVSASESSRFGRVATELSGRSVLTVGELEGPFVVQFVTQQNRIKLRIDLKAAGAARLVLDSRLLRAAEIVRSE